MLPWIFFIIMWIFILFGFPHLSFRASCLREVKRPGNSPTSNSAKPFVMSVDQSQRKLLGKRIVTGIGQGVKPGPGDVLYLVDGDKRTPVVLRRVKTLDMKKEEKGIPLRLVLFGAGSGTLSEKAYMTNIREKKDSGSPKAEKSVNVHYPVVVRAGVGQILSSLLITLFAALVGLLCIWGGMTDPDSSAGAAIGGFCCLIILIVGVYLLAYHLGFKLTILSEEQVRIRRYFRNTEYHINNLLYNIYLSKDKKEIWHLQLMDQSGTVLGDITEKQDRYEEACEAFRKARDRRQKRDLYRYLMEHIFYIPAGVVENEKGDEMNAEPLIMVNSETGQQSIFLFDDEKVMKNDMRDPYDCVIETRLENAVCYLEKYNADCLIAFLNQPMAPEVVEINPKKWEEMKTTSSL